MIKEEWRDIIDYPNYQISSFGNVKSKERYTKQRNGMNLRKEKILIPQKDHKGYLYVRLYNDNGWKYFKIHNLVANAFIVNADNKPTVDHIDRNKGNNNVKNLRYADYQEQIVNRDIDMKLVKENLKKNRKVGLAIKTIKQFDLQGNFIKEWKSSREASQKLNISETSISNCVNKYSKSAGGYIWSR